MRVFAISSASSGLEASTMVDRLMVQIAFTRYFIDLEFDGDHEQTKDGCGEQGYRAGLGNTKRDGQVKNSDH